MKRTIYYRLLLIAVVAAVFLYGFLAYGINLGLDLQGGIHLVLQVDTEEALTEIVLQARERIEASLRDAAITFTEVRATPDRAVEVIGVPVAQRSQARAEIDKDPDWNVSPNVQGDTVDFRLTLQAAARRAYLELTVRQAREVIEKRVDAYGVAEPTITLYGSGEVQDQIIVELPGVEDFDRVLDLIKKAAQLELKLVHPQAGGVYPTREAALQALGGQLPADYEILAFGGRDGQSGFMVVKRAAAITGQHLKDARRSSDPVTGRPLVSFFLNPAGVSLFGRVTGDNVGGYLAIVLDEKVQSAPRIESKIDQESAQITGLFTVQEADDLALVLRSGALPAELIELENRTVGPSLGRDSIEAGMTASALGLILVVLGMLLVYRLAGINAVVCLTLNLLILVGVLGFFEATLTLPGIAGVILTIGMAVDANILIFERIKEELRVGKAVRSAVTAGFDRVWDTILDTNVTTLIASIILYHVGTGPVRGFAVTLGVGLMANLFTATFVSRTLFSLLLERREAGLSI